MVVQYLNTLITMLFRPDRILTTGPCGLQKMAVPNSFLNQRTEYWQGDTKDKSLYRGKILEKSTETFQITRQNWESKTGNSHRLEEMSIN